MKSKTTHHDLFSSLEPLDWAIFILVLIITIAFVYYGNLSQRKEQREFNLLDHLIMGRKLTLPLFVGTLVATWYGGIFGVTQIAYEKGIYNFITQGVFWYIAYIIFAFFLVNKITKFEAMTLPDLVGKMFGPRSRTTAALFNFFNVVPIAYVISLGLFIKAFTHVSLEVGMIIGLAIVLSYSVWGGLRSIVLSDLIQFFVMVSSVLLVLIFSLFKFGGLDFLQAQLPERYFSLTSDEGYLQMFVWGFIALSTLVDPNFYQRCFAAKSPSVAKRGILFSTLIWIVFDLCTTFGAMYARAVLPNSPPGEAYLAYSVQILPTGLKGFFLAGILATVLSTLDSYLFLAGTTLTYDLSSEKQRANPFFHSMGVLFVGILSFAMAKFFDGNIKEVWKTLGSYSAGCILFPILWGHIRSHKLSDAQFVFSCLFSAFTMTLWRIFFMREFNLSISPLYIGVLTSFLALTISTISFKKSRS